MEDVSGHPPIGVHRYRVFGFARGGHVVDVLCIAPDHEDLIGRRALAEHLFPGSGGFEAGLLPHLAKFRNERVLVFLQVVHQRLRHRPGKGLFRPRGAVAGVSRHPHFVLHVREDDGVLAAIHFLDVPHQGGVGARIGFARGIAVAFRDGEVLDALAAPDLGARKPLVILLHPQGSPTDHAVLKAGEPHQADAQVVSPGFLDDAVHQGEIVLALLGFEQLPVNHRKQGVEIHLDELGPHPLHVVEIGGILILDFSRQGYERLAVDDELGGRSLFSQMRETRVRLGIGRNRQPTEPAHQNAAQHIPDLHKSPSRTSAGTAELRAAGRCD